MKFLRQEEGAWTFCVGVAGEFVDVVSGEEFPEDITRFGDIVDFTIMQGLLSQSNTVEVVPFVFCSSSCSRSLSDVLFAPCSSEHTDSYTRSLESSEKKIGGIILSNVVIFTSYEFLN